MSVSGRRTLAREDSTGESEGVAYEWLSTGHGHPGFLMAIKPTVFKAELEIADLSRSYYGSHSLTLARHSSETDERMMVRLLAFALHAHEQLRFTEGLANAEEPAVWQKDLTGALELWIDLGHPEEKRLLKACGRSQQVVVYAYASSTPIWWKGLSDRLRSTANFSGFYLDPKGLAALAERTMKFQFTIQDGQIWLTSGEQTLEFEVKKLL